jgi:hypothetical protein
VNQLYMSAIFVRVSSRLPCLSSSLAAQQEFTSEMVNPPLHFFFVRSAARCLVSAFLARTFTRHFNSALCCSALIAFRAAFPASLAIFAHFERCLGIHISTQFRPIPTSAQSICDSPYGALPSAGVKESKANHEGSENTLSSR